VPRGIANLGNTCFFNSVMQNLIRTEKFRHRILEHTMDGEAIQGESGPLIMKLADFLHTMCSKGSSSTRPSELFAELIRKAPRYKGFQQHDSHELLWTILDHVRMEERGRLRALLPPAPPLEPAAATSSKSAQPEAEAPPARSPSDPPITLVDDIFAGRWRSEIVCSRCSYVSATYEPFLDLVLPIPARFASADDSRDKARRKGAAAEASPAAAAAAEPEELSKRQRKELQKQQAKQKGAAAAATPATPTSESPPPAVTARDFL
jgi:ubiquitin carboxyl-terminal hydrolase 16/45